ncbi:MAG: hypothetical protein GY762_05685, partial [Proteobacteria bacterium]|nr:hypothetical protein [Pseudomonadota bacterium]
RLIADTEVMRFWHKADTEFGTPRANLYLSFRSPVAVATPRDAVLSDLLTRMVEDGLNSFSYPAYLAGLNYELYPHLRGMSMKISGYTDKQPELLQRIVEAMRAREFDRGRFERVRTAMLQEYGNRRKENPSSLVVSELQRLLIKAAWPIEPRIDALRALDLEDLETYAERFFAKGNLLALSHGSRTTGEAQALSSLLMETLLADVDPIEVKRSSVIRLDPSRHYQRTIESDHHDSVVGLYA